MLLLVDDGPFPHLLRNGQWQGVLAHPGREVGAPLVQDLAVNGRSVEPGPFPTAGVFHLYCTIHAGMNLAIVVPS
jgi:plastocyanin